MCPKLRDGSETVARSLIYIIYLFSGCVSKYINSIRRHNLIIVFPNTFFSCGKVIHYIHNLEINGYLYSGTSEEANEDTLLLGTQ